MTSYVVGDIQGSYTAFRQLLDKASFSPDRDSLWCVGDLINRGGESAAVLNFLYEIRDSVTIVLGNHDLYLLALFAGNPDKRASDEMAQVLADKNAHLWFDWLRNQPLVHYDQRRDTLLVHAGIPHIWSVEKALACSDEVHRMLISDDGIAFLRDDIYGNVPDLWHESLQGSDRLRCIINYLTRMRFVDGDGRMNLTITGDIHCATDELQPWFSYQHQDRLSTRIVFGHWASLQGKTGGIETMPLVATDTGYVWKGMLSLFDLDDPAYHLAIKG